MPLSAIDERVDQRLDPQHRRRQPERDPLRGLQRERLRQHLADDDVEVGQDRDGDDAGEAVRREPLRPGGARRSLPGSSRRRRARRTCRARGWRP